MCIRDSINAEYGGHIHPAHVLMLDLSASEIVLTGVVAYTLLRRKDLPQLSYTAGKALGRTLRSLREGYKAIDEFATEHKLPELGQSLQKEVRGLQNVRAELQTYGGLQAAAKFARSGVTASTPSAGTPALPVRSSAAVRAGSEGGSVDTSPLRNRTIVREATPIDAGVGTEQLKGGADYLIACLNEQEVSNQLRSKGFPADLRQPPQ
eukprot:TRINITY_DN18315_c0_g1_i1.p1 TRINITY_DN18315_c0_g1~~TRINITY_DN18315_c0_g1_i1.p1  ORF type:complete len:208 (-),score=39.83 TRINITY_DN18315_c0_g1_i1:131-754(-)